MKTVLIFLITLLFVVPAYAIVISCINEGNNIVRIDYNAGDETSLPAAFALDIVVDNGATIEKIYDYKLGDSNQTSRGFGIFPGTMQMDKNGTTIDWGTPVVSGGSGTSTATLEMASRYTDGENAPSVSGTLCRVIVNTNGIKTVNFTVSQNTNAGGVVLEDGTAAKFSAIGVTLGSATPPPPPPPPTQTDTIIISRVEYNVENGDFRVNATSSAQPTAVLTVVGYGQMSWLADKKKYELKTRISSDPGKTITVTSSNGGTATAEVVHKNSTADTLTILKAEYNLNKRELKVEATSSRQPIAKLNIVNYGPMLWKENKQKYEFRTSPVSDPGGFIAIVSNLGGFADKQIVYKK